MTGPGVVYLDGKEPLITEWHQMYSALVLHKLSDIPRSATSWPNSRVSWGSAESDRSGDGPYQVAAEHVRCSRCRSPHGSTPVAAQQGPQVL